MAAAWLTHVLTHESYRYYKYIILLHMSSLKYLECEGKVDKSSTKWQPLREMLMMCVHIALWLSAHSQNMYAKPDAIVQNCANTPKLLLSEDNSKVRC